MSMKKYFILFLLILSVIVVFLLEFIRENRFVNNAYPTTAFIFENQLKESGLLSFQGNYLTKSFDNEKYTTPVMTAFVCDVVTRKCTENKITKFWGQFVLNTSEYEIKEITNERLAAERITSEIIQTLTVNLNTETVSVNQEPSMKNNGYIQARKNFTSLVPGNVVLKENFKSVLTLIDTPILFIIYKLFR